MQLYFHKSCIRRSQRSNLWMHDPVEKQLSNTFTSKSGSGSQPTTATAKKALPDKLRSKAGMQSGPGIDPARLPCPGMQRSSFAMDVRTKGWGHRARFPIHLGSECKFWKSPWGSPPMSPELAGGQLDVAGIRRPASSSGVSSNNTALYINIWSNCLLQVGVLFFSKCWRVTPSALRRWPGCNDWRLHLAPVKVLVILNTNSSSAATARTGHFFIKPERSSNARCQDILSFVELGYCLVWLFYPNFGMGFPS